MSYTEESDRDMGKNASRSTSPTIAEGDRTVTVVETGEKRREESEETEETRSNYRPAVVTEFVLGLKILNFFPIKRYIMVSSSSLKVVPITSMHSHLHKLKLLGRLRPKFQNLIRRGQTRIYTLRLSQVTFGGSYL